MADVSKDEECARLVAACVDAFGSVDIMVNNVGIRRYQAFLEITPEDWNTVLTPISVSAFYLSRHAIPHMRENKWGRIVLISGFDGFWAPGDASRAQHHLQGRHARAGESDRARIRTRRHHRQQRGAGRDRYRTRLEPVSASGEEKIPSRRSRLDVSAMSRKWRRRWRFSLRPAAVSSRVRRRTSMADII